MSIAPDFFVGVLYSCYVSDIDGGAIADGYNGVSDLVEVLELADGTQQVFCVASRDVPARKVQILVPQLGDYLLD